MLFEWHDSKQLNKLLYNEGNYKQGEKIAFRMGEKSADKELISKNIQAAHEAQYQKNKRPNLKMGQKN